MFVCSLFVWCLFCRARRLEMAAYLNRKGIPVALVVPFDGTGSFLTPANVARLVNLTQRKYAYMRPGPGFHGSLANVDVSGDPNIGHISINKSPRLHARAISEVLAVIKGHRVAAPSAVNPSVANPPAATREGGSAKVPPDGNGIVKPGGKPAPEKSGDGAINSTKLMSPVEGSAPSLRSPTDGTRPKGGRPDRLDPAQLPN
jgi:hypothetical protein